MVDNSKIDTILLLRGVDLRDELIISGSRPQDQTVIPHQGYRVNGVQVLGSQLPGIENASETTASNTAQLNKILDALRAHGLIASA